MKMIDPCDIEGYLNVRGLKYGQWHIYSERPKFLEDGIAIYDSDATSIFIPKGVHKIGSAPSSWSYKTWVDVDAFTPCMPREIYLDLEVFKTLVVETVDIIPFRLDRIIVLRDNEGLVFDTNAGCFDPLAIVFSKRGNNMASTPKGTAMYLYILKYLLFYDVPEVKDVVNSLEFIKFIREILDFPSALFYLLIKWMLMLIFVNGERFAQLFSILAAAYNKETGKTVGEGAIEFMVQTADFDFQKGVERICSLNLSREYFLYFLDFVTNLDDGVLKGSLKGEATMMIIKKLSSFEEDHDDGRFDL